MTSLDIIHLVFLYNILTFVFSIGKLLFSENEWDNLKEAANNNTGIITFTFLLNTTISVLFGYYCFNPLDTLAKVLMGYTCFVSLFAIFLKLENKKV